MPKTSRMGWEYPADEQDPWWDIFEALVKDIDADVYATREASTALITGGGGTMMLTLATNTFSWEAAIELIFPMTGKIVTLAPGAILVADGEVLFVEVARPVSRNVTATVQRATTLPATRNVQMLAVRRGSSLWLADNTLLTGM